MRKNNRVIILDSPIEFILIGTINNKRTVISQSRNAKIDLKSYASRSIFLEKPVSNLLDMKIKLIPIKVEADFEIDSEFIRDDTLTFIWRGLANTKDRKLIENIFDEYSKNIFYAYNRNYDDDFEWFLSDIITLCNQVLEKTHNQIAKKRFFYAIALSIYIIITIALILKFFEVLIFK